MLSGFEMPRTASYSDWLTAATTRLGAEVLQANPANALPRKSYCSPPVPGVVSKMRLQVFPPSAERRRPAPYHESVASLGSPVPPRITPVPPGCTVTAPMLRDVTTADEKASRSSVSGVKVTDDVLAAAFVDFQRPPPVVPAT